MVTALQNQVLVLNRLWQPVNTCTARRAVSLLYLRHAEVVHTDEDRNYDTHDIDSWLRLSAAGELPSNSSAIRSVTHTLYLPHIIVLALFDRLPKKQVKFTRDNVFRRDSHTCQYCGTRFEPRDLNLDHVVPRDKGGKTSWENVVCSCISCNTRKGNKMPFEVKMFPRKKPRPPSWRPLFSAARRPHPPHPSWTHFLDLPEARVDVGA